MRSHLPTQQAAKAHSTTLTLKNGIARQIKMALTRQGFNSKMVVTGDVTQIDLPNWRRSGLLEAVDVLAGVEGIAFVHFDEQDVVRHPLVGRIVEAYDADAVRRSR